MPQESMAAQVLPVCVGEIGDYIAPGIAEGALGGLSGVPLVRVGSGRMK